MTVQHNIFSQNQKKFLLFFILFYFFYFTLIYFDILESYSLFVFLIYFI